MATQTQTMTMKNAKYLEGDTDSQLEELARGYLCYLTWEQSYGGETFHQIMERDFDGNKDHAFQDFLYYKFRYIQIGRMPYILKWVLEKDILLMPEEASSLLFKIKTIVMTYSFEDLKEMIGLSDFVLK